MVRPVTTACRNRTRNPVATGFRIREGAIVSALVARS